MNLPSQPPAALRNTTSSGRPPALATWRSKEITALGETSLQGLLDNEVPLLVIRDFATAAECKQLVAAAAKIGFEPYQHVDPPIDRIGITVFEYSKADMAEYFRRASETRAEQMAIFNLSFDPIARLIDRLSKVWAGPVGIAEDPRRGPFHAGLVRRIENGTLLHIDYAPAEHPSWHVESVCSQLAWNLYLELPESGGKTHIFNRPWQSEDERFKVEGTYGYSSHVVAGAERMTFQPTLGDLYIFNTRNYHEVDPSVGRRTTFTSAIGSLNDSLVLWS